MKKLLILCLVALAILFGAVYLASRHRGEAPLQPTASPPTEASESASDKAVREAPHINPRGGTTNMPAEPAKESTAASPAVTRPSGEVRSQLEEFSKQVHRPIEFYGKVVDENNSPVGGADVSLVWSHYVLPATTYRTNLTSDADGLFSFKGVEGATLDVSVQKEGYYTVKSVNPGRFTYSENYGSTPFRPDPRSPVVLHLRKKGPGAVLVTSQHGIAPDLDVSTTDNAPTKVDLLSKKAGAEGQLEIVMWHDQKDPTTQQNNWYVRIAVPEGGLVENNDEFPFEAPQTGFVSAYEWGFTNGSPAWKASMQKSFYIQFGNPPKFGRLDLHAAAFHSGVSIGYAFNPDGSRYLEPK